MLGLSVSAHTVVLLFLNLHRISCGSCSTITPSSNWTSGVSFKSGDDIDVHSNILFNTMNNTNGSTEMVTEDIVDLRQGFFDRRSVYIKDSGFTAYDLLFIFIMFGMGALMRTLTFTFNLKMIYKVLLFLLGAFYGWLCEQSSAINNFTNVSKIHTHLLLLLFMPIIVFKTAYFMDAHTFLRGIWQILILGTLGFMISASLMAAAMMFMFDYHWSFEVSLLFGIIASTIYPHDVVVALKELGHSKHLSILLEGEALVSWGMAITVYHVVHLKLVFPSMSGVDMFVTFIACVFGEPLFGLVVGKITVMLMACVYNDPVACTTITFVAAFATYIIGDETLNLAGPFGVVVLGVFVSSNRTNFPVDVDGILCTFWDMLAYLANTSVLILFGIIILDVVYDDFILEDIVKITLTYVVSVVIRFVMFLLLAPMLSRLGFGLPWRNGLVAAWGGLRGSLPPTLALIYLNFGNKRDGMKFVIHVAGLLVLTFIINGCTIQMMFRYLGMGEISLAKKTNMNHAMKYLEAHRERAIATLKMDRFLADANWIVVEEHTHIKHPYKLKKLNKLEDDEEENINYLGYRLTTCPSCEREILTEPTPQEYREMMREAKLRLLKAKRVCYWRQFEHGLVSKEALRVLVAAVDLAADREDLVMEVGDIAMSWSKSEGRTTVRNKLVTLMSTRTSDYMNPPRERWRKKFFRVATNKWFEVIIYLTITLNIIQIAIEIFLDPPSKTNSNIALKVMNSIFFAIYLTEFVIKDFAFYFKGYIKSHWNKLDFAILIIAFTSVVMDYVELFALSDKTSLTSTVSMAMKLLRMCRLLRLLRLTRSSLPTVIAFLDSRMDAQMAIGFDVGKGFVTGEEEIIKVLPHIADNRKVFEELETKINTDRLTVIKHLGMMQRDRPWIAITVKSRQAIRSILSSIRDAIQELKEGGLLDEVEFMKLIAMLEDQLKYLSTHLSIVAPCPPEVLFKEVPWIIGHDTITDFLLSNAELVTFNMGDVMVREGDSPSSLYILVSGLVKLTYVPTKRALQNLYTHGTLPNVDFISSLRFEEKQVDYVVSGNVIGELGVLTGRPYDVNIVCESAVQAYRLAKEVMETAFSIAPDLQGSMWKALSYRLAGVILMNVPTYQSWTPTKIKFHLERGFVPMSDLLRVFVVNELVEDVLLIEGQVMDAANRVVYTAPAYIPRTVNRLLFPNSSMMNVTTPTTTRLLVIPASDIDEFNLMETEAGAVTLTVASTLCLQHSVQSRLSDNVSFRRPAKQTRIARGRVWDMFGLNKPRPNMSLNKAPSSSALGLAMTGNKVHPGPEERFQPDDTTQPGRPTSSNPEQLPVRRDSEDRYNEKQVPTDVAGVVRLSLANSMEDLQEEDEGQEDEERKSTDR